MIIYKTIKNLIWALIFIITTTGIYSQTLPKFSITTENWKPYQYIENNEITGISVDIMELMLKQLNSEQKKEDIKILPWSRAYNNALKKDNTILFLTSRTKEREKLFKWVGPVLEYKNYLIARKDQNITISNTKDLNKYKIGSVIDDASEIFLQNLGVPLNKLVRAHKGSDVVKILDKGRIQILLSEWTSFIADIEHLELNINNFEPIYLASESKLYYAFSSSTSDEVISRFQATFDILLESGKITEVFNKYGEDLIEVEYTE
ncbi:MAG: ABC transporter substrate-binding protein [Spirochaetaceae bacterium]